MPLRDAGNELALRKPSWRRGLYELHAGDELVGLLDVKAWSGASRAETTDGAWRLDRPRGFSQRRVRVLTADGDGRELATFHREGMSGRRGAIELDGRRYKLRAHGWWKPRWVWTTEDGEELAALTTRDTFREERGRASLTDCGPRVTAHRAAGAARRAPRAGVPARAGGRLQRQPASARSGPWR